MKIQADTELTKKLQWLPVIPSLVSLPEPDRDPADRRCTGRGGEGPGAGRSVRPPLPLGGGGPTCGEDEADGRDQRQLTRDSPPPSSESEQGGFKVQTRRVGISVFLLLFHLTKKIRRPVAMAIKQLF